MNETIPLPELCSADLDAPGLRALLDDVGACTQLLGITAKFAPRLAVPDSSPSLSLAEAGRVLLAGEVRGVQLRYLFHGAEWWDSIICQPGCRWRLVRIQHAPAVAPVA